MHGEQQGEYMHVDTRTARVKQELNYYIIRM